MPVPRQKFVVAAAGSRLPAVLPQVPTATLSDNSSVMLVAKYSNEVRLPAPEHEEVPRERILPQDTLDLHGEPIDALTHID